MAHLHKRALPLSANEGNSGPIDSLTFDAGAQFVDVRPGTTNEFKSPGLNDLRGPCPGLNAAANHGFLPRTGITSVQTTVDGLSKAYGFGPEFAAALSAIAIALTGDPTGLTWSIGGPYPPALLGGVITNPEGISYSHNAYESDASPTRDDAYLNNGDAYTLDLSKFKALYSTANANGEFTLDILRNHNKQVHDYSVQHNPYFFSAPFAGLVPPIAHHFVVNLMSNHSAARPNGFLTKAVLKSFFAISGPDNNLVYNKGQERIPLNWYRRPLTNPYDAAAAAADVAILATKYPDIVEVGGNTGTVNSFTGVDVGNITGGVYNAKSLLVGNNAACFAFQAAQQAIPGVLSGLVAGILTPVLNLVNNAISPVTSSLNCPALLTFDQSKFNQYPGYKYHPKI
ncbi:Cloroperoxidase [Mytilinidion resinicola]|uniref:Cloroperoxidase n=1 Tax=Mytilinidion resinicola TaxID=574789 RepID=A0A6A6Y310_9PEZI|nr:Cloroperoxidase [Mytilinidion resinicola]KAF2803216.1 Cloroperoxidase [Mytilinidion resinicola]